MTTDATKPEPGADGANILHEADIGSGERSPGQQETDEMIREIPSQISPPPPLKDGSPETAAKA